MFFGVLSLASRAFHTSCTFPTDMTNTGKHCEQDSVSNRQSDLFTLDPIAGHCHLRHTMSTQSSVSMAVTMK
jgi:hypothetical protein